jgi:heterodisulfide reductase subunit C2
MAETIQWKTDGFLSEVESRSGTPVSACYQCHKCSTGCPIGAEMDFLPSQIMRLIHFGAAGEALESESIWLCASCAACTTRCPNEIDIAGVMDTLRIMAIDRKVSLPDARGMQFNRAFLGSMRLTGRVFELGMLAEYKLRSLDLFSDVDKVPQMLLKGKLAFIPPHTGGTRDVREVFQQAEEEKDTK